MIPGAPQKIATRLASFEFFGFSFVRFDLFDNASRLALCLRYYQFDRAEEVNMADVIFIGITTGFFYLAWLYVRACERL